MALVTPDLTSTILGGAPPNPSGNSSAFTVPTVGIPYAAGPAPDAVSPSAIGANPNPQAGNFDWTGASKSLDYYGKLAQPGQGAGTAQTAGGIIGMGLGAGVGAYFGGPAGAQLGAGLGKTAGSLVGGLADYYDQSYQKEKAAQEAEDQKLIDKRRLKMQEYLDNRNIARNDLAYQQNQDLYKQQQIDTNRAKIAAAQGIVHNFLAQRLAKQGLYDNAGQNAASLGINTSMRGAFG